MNKLLSPKAIYPAITVVFLIIVGVTFFYIARFFSRSINEAFQIDQTAVESSLTKVDITKYKAIAPRLNLEDPF